MSKFEDYEASYITPQKTLLKKFNEVLKYLRDNNPLDERENLYLYWFQDLVLTTDAQDDITLQAVIGISSTKYFETNDDLTPKNIKHILDYTHFMCYHQSDAEFLIADLIERNNNIIIRDMSGAEQTILEINAIEVLQVNLKTLETELFEI